MALGPKRGMRTVLEGRSKDRAYQVVEANMSDATKLSKSSERIGVSVGPWKLEAAEQREVGHQERRPLFTSRPPAASTMMDAFPLTLNQ
jgi:hypothetical protein